MLLDLWHNKSHSIVMPQQPVPNKVVAVDHLAGDRFVISLQVEVPPNVTHLEINTHKLGETAYVKPLTTPRAGSTVMLITGEGHPEVKVGDSLPVWST